MRRTIAALVIVLHGCSFAFVSGPPANHEQLPSFNCSEGRWAPIVDTVIAALQLLNAVSVLTTNDQKWHDLYCSPNDTTCTAPVSKGAIAGINLGVVAITGVSALYGYSRVGRCRDAKAELATRSAAPVPQPTAPGTWPPPAATGAGSGSGNGFGSATPVAPPPPAPAPAPTP